MSPRFHSLKVIDVKRETPDAVSIAFELPEDLKEDYSYIPGQYLTLKADINGEDVRRSYSICSGKGEDIRVAVKKIDDGLFSSYANDDIAIGMNMDIMTPMGRFYLPENATGEARTYVGFAAGSGITPIMSIIKEVMQREPESQFFLFYGNRTSQTIIFKEQLDDLKDRYLGRLSVYHILSREEQELSLLNGRLDEEKVNAFLTSILPAGDIDHAFLCGPGEMIEEARIALEKTGLDKERIHNELFTPADGSPSHEAHEAKDAKAVDHKAKVDMIVDGARYSLDLEPGETIIDAALKADIEAPFSCKGGMCCTCRAKVLEGEVDMAINYSLEPWEVEANFVLTCQSRPKTDKVVVDFDVM
jgi:ring-1,2-phenylacetyl-CoA epoxidase subunit PaaE